MHFKLWLETHSDEIPPEPGTIPPGQKRLDVSLAKGSTYGEPNLASTQKPLIAKRGKDFSTTGSYEVETPQGMKQIYRNPENGWWYLENDPLNTPYFHPALGFKKAEALEKLAKRFPAG